MYKGILEDNRPQSLKDKDYDALELGVQSPKWLTRATAIKNASKYISRNQYSKSSCVSSSICNALWNTESTELADEFLYTQRMNKPAEGCYWYDQADLVIKQGTCSREAMKEVKTEKEANNVVITGFQTDNACLYKQLSYINITKPTIEDLSKWANQGYAVPFSIWATSKEWSLEYPEIKDTTLTREKATILHAICVIPNTGYTYKGKKYVIITDSSHFGKRYIRHLSEDFLAVRTHHGVVFTDLAKNLLPNIKTKYSFTRDLTVGDTGEDVKMLQKVLQDLGFFPSNFECTETFAGITRQAVKDFQKKYEESILWSIGLKLPTGYFGKSSRAKLNSLLS